MMRQPSVSSAGFQTTRSVLRRGLARMANVTGFTSRYTKTEEISVFKMTRSSSTQFNAT